MQYLFRYGVNYIAGFDRPTIVSIDTIKEAVESEGFNVLVALPCEGPMPFATPTPCGDEWDWIALFKRTEADKSFELPDRVKWVIESPEPKQAPGHTQPVDPPKSATENQYQPIIEAGLGKVLIAAGMVGYVLIRLGRR